MVALFNTFRSCNVMEEVLAKDGTMVRVWVK